MKKILLIVFTAVLISNFYSNGYSQSFGIGYRAGSGTFKPLDFVIDRYNNTRTAILTKQMDKITSVSGPVYSVGYNLGEFGFEVEIPNLKSPTVTAETSTQVRELYLNMTGFELNFSYAQQVFKEGNLYGFIGGSLSVDKSDPSIYTRIYNKNSPSGDFTQVKANGSVGMGIGPLISGHLAFSSVAFFAEVRPFYKFTLSGADFYDVNRALNPNTWYNDEVDDTQGSMNYFGINARVGITVDIL